MLDQGGDVNINVNVNCRLARFGKQTTTGTDPESKELETESQDEYGAFEVIGGG